MCSTDKTSILVLFSGIASYFFSCASYTTVVLYGFEGCRKAFNAFFYVSSSQEPPLEWLLVQGRFAVHFTMFFLIDIPLLDLFSVSSVLFPALNREPSLQASIFPFVFLSWIATLSHQIRETYILLSQNYRASSTAILSRNLFAGSL